MMVHVMFSIECLLFVIYVVVCFYEMDEKQLEAWKPGSMRACEHALFRGSGKMTTKEARTKPSL